MSTPINEYGDPLRSAAEPPLVDLDSKPERLAGIHQTIASALTMGLEAAFDDAFAAAQAHFQPVIRSRTVEVRMRPEKGGGTYTFKYAPLEEILKKCLPALNAQGIGWKQFIRIKERREADVTFFDHFVVSRMTYKGWKDESETIIFKTSADAQSYGAAVTYAKRMGAQNAFGVAADDDNDGHGPGSEWIGGNAFGDQDRGQVGGSARPTQKPQDGRKGKPAATGQAIGKDSATVAKPAEKDPPRKLSEIEIARLEGQVTDAVSEMQEACVEGRRIGIEQIWNEVRSNEYVATRLWSEMKTKTPDLFKVMEDVLRPKETKGPRGPAPATGDGARS
jgi:hypothetical protein